MPKPDDRDPDQAAPQPTQPPARRRARVATIGLAAVLGLAAVGFVVVHVVPVVTAIYRPVYRGDPHPVTEEQEHEAWLARWRHGLVVRAVEEGLEACAREDWVLCRERLSQAEHDEPDVARDPRVIAARKADAVAYDKALLESARRSR